MKGITINWIKTFLFLMIAPALTNDTERCEPFKALIIWHTSSGEDASFFQARRLLLLVIDDLPQGTDVILLTIGADANIDKQFQKEAANYSWRDDTILLHEPGNSGNHVIPSNDISEAVFNYLDQNKMPKRAEEVFLIVTNKSVIDNEGMVKEVLRKKKTFVVVCGKQTDRNVWTDLATDNNHLKELQNSWESLNSTEKSLRNIYCKDSKLLCDTDEYWTGDRCYRCSYICSSSPSEYCLKKCRYLNHSGRDTDYVDKTSVNDENELKTIITWLTIIIGFISVLIFIVVILFCWLGRESLMFIEKSGREMKKPAEEETENESDFHEVTPFLPKPSL